MAAPGKLTVAAVLVTLAVLAGTSHSTSTGIVDKNTFNSRMKKYWDQLKNARHPRKQNDWMNARKYVKQEMEHSLEDVQEQCFNTSVAMDDIDDIQEVVGCNIIGISKGSSTKNLLVIGAQFDSSGDSSNDKPLRDNGVGLSVMLEIIRAYEDSWRWKGWERNYTTVFVAFDLNTKEELPQSPGHPGSYYFVQNWLQPKLFSEKRSLGGSYIIDSIATYNTDEDSQVLPADFKTVFPSAFDRIANDSRRGDFLAAISPDGQYSKQLLQDFSGHYRMDQENHPFRLQELQAGQNEFGTSGTLDMVNHQASIHFWMAQPAMPSVLLTDTGKDRVWPKEEQCDSNCDYVFANSKRLDFVYQTYEALFFTILQRQATYVGLSTGAAPHLPAVTASSLLSLVLGTIVARLLTA